MGQRILWQYHLVWAPEAARPTFSLYRRSSAGHTFQWASIPADPVEGMPSLDQVLQEFYGGLLEIMKENVE